MAVLQSKNFLSGYTPHCSDCGIALCYDISEEDYQELPAFWDNWKCASCNPDAKGAWMKARLDRGLEPELTDAETGGQAGEK